MRKKKTLVPLWNDKLYFEHNYYHFLRDNVIFMFEVLDFIKAPGSDTITTSNRSRGVHHIAWGFLKCVSASGRSNTESRMRLQLYKYPSLGIQGIKRLAKNKTNTTESDLIDAGRKLFELYQTRDKAKTYPSSLYVTLKAYERPSRTVVQYPNRALEPNQKETGRYTLDQMLQSGLAPLTAGETQETNQKKLEEEKKRIELEKRRKRVARKRNERCEIPNKLLCRIDSARGCICTRFSHCGRYLACGCGASVRVFDIWNNGHLDHEFTGHVNIVYDVNWSSDDQMLVTASSDGTARIWHKKSTENKVTSLQHPCFVYAAVFHPADSRIVVTGAYDGKIRVWFVDGGSTEMLKELSGHDMRVNSVCFDAEGGRMYSADGSGVIKAWSSRIAEGDDRKFAGESFSVIRTIEDEEIARSNLTCIRVDPRNPLDRLLVHSQDNMIRRLDVSTRVIRCRYSGVKCHMNAQKSNFSPDGRFVVCGADNGRVFFWNTETGDLIDKEGKDYGFDGRPVYDVAWSNHEHVMALCSFDDQPVRVFFHEKKGVIDEGDVTEQPSARNYPTSSLSTRPTTAVSPSNAFRNIAKSLPLTRPKTPPPSSFHRPTTGAGHKSPTLMVTDDYNPFVSPSSPLGETKTADAFDEMLARYTETLMTSE
jgi:jouberin